MCATASLRITYRGSVASFSQSRFPLVTALVTELGAADQKQGESLKSPLSDEELLKGIARGDVELLAVLYRRYAKLAYGIGMRILQNPVESEDLVQDIFLYIHRKGGVFDPGKGQASSWIVQLIYYQALQRRLRLNGRRCESLEAASVECSLVAKSTAAEYDQTLDGMLGRRTWSFLRASLTEDQWQTLQLHFFEGYTLSEIAKIKEQPLGNIRHHFYRGLEKLRAQLFQSELPERIASGTR